MKFFWGPLEATRSRRQLHGIEAGIARLDASAGRDFQLHTAHRQTASDLGASAAEARRLLEAVASPANLATALLNVATLKGGAGRASAAPFA